MNTIWGIWSPQKGVEISELGKNLFVFQFSVRKYKQRVLDNQSWHFDPFLLVREEQMVMNNHHPLNYLIYLFGFTPIIFFSIIGIEK